MQFLFAIFNKFKKIRENDFLYKCTSNFGKPVLLISFQRQVLKDAIP